VGGVTLIMPIIHNLTFKNKRKTNKKIWAFEAFELYQKAANLGNTS